MPALYNQTKTPLRFELGGKTFECEPWGAVDVPDKLRPFCESYGLPLGTVPVAPELRAKVRVEQQRQDQYASVVRALKQEADGHKATADAAKRELEKVQGQLQKQADALRESRALAERLQSELNSALADKGAAESLLNEHIEAASQFEERALKAEALLHEQGKKSKKNK